MQGIDKRDSAESKQKVTSLESLEKVTSTNGDEKKSALLSNCRTPMKSKWDVPPLHGHVTPLIATIKYNNNNSSSKSNLKPKIPPISNVNTIAIGDENTDNSNVTAENNNIKEKEKHILFFFRRSNLFLFASPFSPFPPILRTLHY